MTLLWIVIALFVVGASIGAYALFARRAAPAEATPKLPAEAPATVPEPLKFTPADWASEAGEEFRGLSESERCDLIFAVGALDDERGNGLLVRALDDPAEPVALAAAHSLARNGRLRDVESFIAERPGERAAALERTLALLQ